MRTPLWWLNLTHSKARTALAVAGVTFAVVLILMQLGFLGAAENGATLLYDALDFDILVRSRHYLHIVAPRSVPRTRLYQAAAVPGVTSVRPLYVGSNFWRRPDKEGPEPDPAPMNAVPVTAGPVQTPLRLILLLGCNPAEPVFKPQEIREKLPVLTRPDYVLIDRRSRRQFGPQDDRQFGDADIGVETEIGQRRVHIAGHYGLGTGFSADGAVLVNEQGFIRLFPALPKNEVSLGLIKIPEAAVPEEVATALRESLPADVEVCTRAEVNRFEIRHWVYRTPIGIVFLMGVGVALIVGAAIVYEVLASDVANHLSEYATLKAIGYAEGFLSAVVLKQAVLLALLGYVPGVAIAEALYALTAHFARIPIGMTWLRIASVLGLAVLMCIVSGLGALRKVQTADPADLF
jgi:putative ABC transport system permease protein